MTIKVDIVTEYKDKGAKKAQSSLFSIEGAAKKLAGTLTKTFAVYQIVQFGKAAAQAFAQDQASAASLANTLKNLNAELSIPAAESAIAQLQQMTAVVDDELRPAFAQLFRILGSVSEASSTLGLATEISRGTGESLATVVDAITKAYAGNTKGLLALNTGLTKAEINSGNMQMIMEKLNGMFSGSNAAYLQTYAGKMQALSVTASDAMEKIGAGIFDALQTLTGSTTLDELQTKVSNFATELANAIRGIAKLIKTVYDFVHPFLLTIEKAYGILKKIGVIKDSVTAADMTWGNVYGDPAAQAAAANDKKLAAQRLAQEKKLIAEQKRAAAAKLKAERDAQTLKKAGTMFDIDKIQIIAALQGKITDEEKTRLQLQFALLVGNADEADRLSNQLAISQLATTQLANAIANLPKALNPFADYPAFVQQAAAELAKLGGVMSPTAGNLSNPFVGNYAQNYGAYAESPFTPYSGNQNPISYNITVNGVVGSASDVSEVIRQQLLNQSNTGSGAFVNTLKGIS
jgi:hypothetical protein